jgi:glycosyltransferase involved in cell wall biosynthesis
VRICLDARQIRRYPTGLGSYAKYLVQHLAAVDDDNDYVVLRHDSNSPVVEKHNFTEITLPYTIFTLRNMVAGAAAVRHVEADIYHSLFHFLPLGNGLPKTVVTLHDLIAVEHSKLSLDSPAKRWWKSNCVRPLLRHALSKADHIVADSDSTRSAALARYRLEPGRITTVRPGVDTNRWDGTGDVALPDVARSANRRFIFSLGNTHPYKNVPRLVHAFASIAPTFPEVDLVVTGRGRTYATLQRLADRAGISARVKFTGTASDEEVMGCFKEALFFAFPSLVEGFGLPVLEAMACGCPVLTSNCSALKEVAEGAAELVDPTDVNAIAAGMSKLIQQEELRRDLIERGKTRARAMTWEQTAQQMVAIYRELTA